MSQADGIVYMSLEEPDSDAEWHVPDGNKCTDCDHFMKDRDDEDTYWHDGLPYCEDCFAEAGYYPSEDYWDLNNMDNFLSVDDADSFYGDDDE